MPLIFGSRMPLMWRLLHYPSAFRPPWAWPAVTICPYRIWFSLYFFSHPQYSVFLIFVIIYSVEFFFLLWVNIHLEIPNNKNFLFCYYYDLDFKNKNK